MIKKVLILCFLLFLSIPETLAAIRVSPTVIEMNSKNTKSNYITSSFNVQSDPNDTVRFKIYPEFFNITSQGKMEMLEKTASKNSLVNNIKFVPSEFTLQNGRTQKVRLTITDFNSLPDGESRLVLFLEDVNVKEITLPNKDKNVSTRLLVKTRIGIPIYLDNKKTIKKCNFETLDIQKEQNKLICNMKLLSTGNSRVRYSGKVQLIKDSELVNEYKINNGIIGSNNFLITQEVIPIKNLKEKGDYKIRCILNYRDENLKNKLLIKEAKFTINNLDSSSI